MNIVAAGVLKAFAGQLGMSELVQGGDTPLGLAFDGQLVARCPT